MPTPPAKTPTGRTSQGKGLSRKLGPLPVWGWGVGVLGAILLGLLMRRRIANAGQSGTLPASGATDPGSAGGGGGAIPGTGGGQQTDLSGIEQQLADLTALLGANSFGADDFSGADFGNTAAPAADQGLKETAPAYPLLTWGGKVFSDQAHFQSWLSGHGGNLADFQKRHPAAFRTLETLPRGHVTPTPRARPDTSGGRDGGGQPHGSPNRPNATPNVIDHPSVVPHVPVPGKPRAGGGGRTYAE